MHFCLRTVCACALAALAAHAATPVRVRSVVRAGANGRLVRAVVVSPKVVNPKIIEPSAAPVADAALTTPISAAPPLRTPGDFNLTEFVEATAKKYEVDPLLVHSVIQVESAYNPRAVSHKGAQGLMQLMPGTARRFGVSNSFDPRENIEGGVRYLRYLTSLFPNDLRLAIAAYNAGEAAVWKYNNQIPPYRETEQYVYLVGRRYGQALRDSNRRKELNQPVSAATIASAATPGTTSVTAGPASGPQTPSYAPVRYVYDANGGLKLTTDQALP